MNLKNVVEEVNEELNMATSCLVRNLKTEAIEWIEKAQETLYHRILGYPKNDEVLSSEISLRDKAQKLFANCSSSDDYYLAYQELLELL